MKHLHLVVGCERGLCGVVGANLPKRVTQTVRQAKKDRPDITNEVVVLGKKSATKIKATLKEDVTHAYVGSQTKMPTFATCLEMTDHIMKNNEFGRCTVYYNDFKMATSLYACVSEQLASEMASRLASMEGASKTCTEKAKEYFSIYQKLRKQKITNELTVLSVGAKLAKKK